MSSVRNIDRQSFGRIWLLLGEAIQLMVETMRWLLSQTTLESHLLLSQNWTRKCFGHGKFYSKRAVNIENRGTPRISGSTSERSNSRYSPWRRGATAIANTWELLNPGGYRENLQNLVFKVRASPQFSFSSISTVLS